MQELFSNADVDVVPRQSFVEVVGANNCCDIYTTLVKCLLVVFVVEHIAPSIKTSAMLVGLVKSIGNCASTTSKHRFEQRAVVVVVGKVDALFAKVFRKVALFLLDTLSIGKGAPLERRKWLGDKCGARNGNAQVLATLFDPFVQRFNFARQVVDTFDIFHCFGGKTEHKVQFYRCVALVEGIC